LGYGRGVVIAWAKVGLAADKVHYSGKYSADRRSAKSGIETDSTLEVVQNEDDIVVKRVELGKRTSSHCPLNGSEGDYTSPDDTAHFLLVTFWESEEALSAFGGEDISVAKYYDFDKDLLIELA
jgi:hypothetical protein